MVKEGGGGNSSGLCVHRRNINWKNLGQKNYYFDLTICVSFKLCSTWMATVMRCLFISTAPQCVGYFLQRRLRMPGRFRLPLDSKESHKASSSFIFFLFILFPPVFIRSFVTYVLQRLPRSCSFWTVCCVLAGLGNVWGTRKLGSCW